MDYIQRYYIENTFRPFPCSTSEKPNFLSKNGWDETWHRMAHEKVVYWYCEDLSQAVRIFLCFMVHPPETDCRNGRLPFLGQGSVVKVPPGPSPNQPQEVAGMALVKPCPRCKKLIPHGWSYCPDCKPIAEAQRQEARERKAEHLRKKYNRRYNARRDPKYMEFYRSKAWKNTSKAKLQSVHYKCTAGFQGCTGIACEVHHIKPIQTEEGWNLRLDWDNLEPLCTACHNGRHPEKFRRKEDPNILDVRKIMNNIPPKSDEMLEN